MTRLREIAVLLSASMLYAQSWTQATPAAGSPSPRYFHAMAYDAARSRIVLFGGLNSAPTYYGDTWEWDGTTWTMRSPANRPAARSACAMAYDVRRQRIVLFGGSNPSTAFGDTWEWDGQDWTVMFPRSMPTPRAGQTMTYDPVQARILMFGPGTIGQSAETWQWDGTNWLNVSPPVSPYPYAPAMDWDGARQRVVLASGGAVAGPFETWEWMAGAWTQTSPVASPGPRRGGFSATYASDAARFVLFGGFDAFSSRLDETWEYDGATWVRITTSARPSARTWSAQAYDSKRKVIVLFGGASPSGMNDTWEYFSPVTATYGTFGAACGGPQGTPGLSAFAGQRPIAGQSFVLTITGVLPSATTVVYFGFSKTAWGTTPLPLDLTTYGMPGCALAVSVDAVFALPAIGGTVLVPVGIPSNPWLIGQHFFNQAWAPDPTANPLGVAVSNAGDGLIGGR